MSYEELFDYLKKRFKGAQFVVSCFDTIDEVETKPLTSRDEILYMDCYTISTLPKGKRKWIDEDFFDYFLVRKKEGQEFIRYCDVIDTLIENNFERNIHCDHKFLESIGLVNEYSRNKNSIPVYASFWGS